MNPALSIIALAAITLPTLTDSLMRLWSAL